MLPVMPMGNTSTEKRHGLPSLWTFSRHALRVPAWPSEALAKEARFTDSGEWERKALRERKP